MLASIGVKVVPTKYVPEQKVSDYDLLVLPGGAKAMEYMRQGEGILKFIADFHASGNIIYSFAMLANFLFPPNLLNAERSLLTTASRTTSQMLAAPMWMPPMSLTIGLSLALTTSISGRG